MVKFRQRSGLGPLPIQGCGGWRDAGHRGYDDISEAPVLHNTAQDNSGGAGPCDQLQPRRALSATAWLTSSPKLSPSQLTHTLTSRAPGEAAVTSAESGQRQQARKEQAGFRKPGPHRSASVSINVIGEGGFAVMPPRDHGAGSAPFESCPLLRPRRCQACALSPS